MNSGTIDTVLNMLYESHRNSLNFSENSLYFCAIARIGAVALSFIMLPERTGLTTGGNRKK